MPHQLALLSGHSGPDVGSEGDGDRIKGGMRSDGGKSND